MPIKKILLLLLLVCGQLFSQDFTEDLSADLNVFQGNIMPHAPDLHHFLAGHPQGFMVGVVRQTYGEEEWEQAYNFPDYGLYLLYQDFKNPILGHNYAIGLQYNFYFLNRKLQFKISQGIAMTSHPHDNETNYRNSAFGSKFMENTNFALNFKQRVYGKFSVQGGLMFTHFSNGRIKSPNSGVNTYNANLGISYDFGDRKTYNKDLIAKSFKEPLKYNFVLRTGVNESLIIGSGQYAFYHPGIYVDKRFGRKFSLQAGAEIFFSNFMKDYIRYRSVAYPESNIDPDTDWKRAGLFIGTEMFINRLSFEAQLGYYVYQPFKTENKIYDRVGAKYYFYKNYFAGVSVKTHGFLAEAMEFNLGVRL